MPKEWECMDMTSGAAHDVRAVMGDQGSVPRLV